MIKDFNTYISEGLFDRNQSEFNIQKTDKGIEQVCIPKTKNELYKYIDIAIESAKKDGIYPDVNLNNIDVSKLGHDVLKGLFGDVYKQINPDISNWDIKYIPNNFFDSNKQIKEFTIPNSVTSIGFRSFGGCDCLVSITIPDSVTSIGDCALFGCTSLTSVEIPNSVTSIDDWTFGNCSSLTSVEIPNSVTSIDDFAFSGCIGLTYIEISNSVTRIGQQTFYGCEGLTSVTIGNSVTSIGCEVFEGCSSLTSVVWNAKNCSDFEKDSTPFYYNDYYTLYDLRPQITSFTFGNEVEYIPDNLCSGMPNLTSIVIPNSVTCIGNHAFTGCRGLTSVTIPDSVAIIGEDSFFGCTGLTSVTISKHCHIEMNSFPKKCKIIRK